MNGSWPSRQRSTGVNGPAGGPPTGGTWRWTLALGKPPPANGPANGSSSACAERLRRAPGNHRVGDGVGVLLVAVAAPSDTAGELDPAALLHHMRGLVRRGVQIGLGFERNLVTRRIRLRADRARRVGRSSTHVGADAADIMMTEQALDLVVVRQLGRRASDAARRRFVDSRAVGFAPRLHDPGRAADRGSRVGGEQTGQRGLARCALHGGRLGAMTLLSSTSLLPFHGPGS